MSSLGQYDHLVHGWYLDRCRGLQEARRERLAALRTANDARDYAESMGEPVRAAFRNLPTERCPLNAATTSRVEGPEYDIECLHFDSRPGLPVTANLYLPAACRTGAKVPGIIHSCGHSFTGKAEDKYQEACARLARSGMAVLIYDPINQGERDQYYCGVCNAPIDADPTPSRAGLPATHHLRAACTCAHNMMGKQLELLDDFFGAWRAWDGMRALDYLLSREEIDTDHLGITGTRSPTHPTTLPHPASLSLCHSPRPSRSRAAVDPPRRELRRGDDDLLDLGGRPPLHHGRALLLHHHIREEPGERNPGRR